MISKPPCNNAASPIAAGPASLVNQAVTSRFVYPQTVFILKIVLSAVGSTAEIILDTYLVEYSAFQDVFIGL